MKQLLHFLGNGSGFSKTHTNAYFYHNDELILLDASMLNFAKITELLQGNFIKVNLLITHMHDDHVSALSLLSQYLYYVKNKKLNILIPRVLKEDILLELKIKGIDISIVNIEILEEKNYDWLIAIIPTTHVPELKDKCFGYVLQIENSPCIYSGDTCSLQPYLEHFEKGSQLYLDVSFSYGKVHLLWSDVKDELMKYQDNMDIFLMHIDDEHSLQKAIKSTKIRIVEV